MCGIVAMYSAREPILAGALVRATRRLTHRGPDGQRTWLADDRRVGLGHARLSIIDLATGDQPIAGEPGPLSVRAAVGEPARRPLQGVGPNRLPRRIHGYDTTHTVSPFLKVRPGAEPQPSLYQRSIEANR